MLLFRFDVVIVVPSFSMAAVVDVVVSYGGLDGWCCGCGCVNRATISCAFRSASCGDVVLAVVGVVDADVAVSSVIVYD
jgi:hypothetical protein